MVLPVRHNLPQKLAPFAVAMLFLTSCGSSKQASYYEDGIYNQGNREVQIEKKTPEADNAKTQQHNTYEDYFGQRGKAYGKILDDEIFTDVDSYSGTATQDSISEQQQTNYFTYNNTYAGHPGWGDNPTGVTVNLYNNGDWGYPYWRYPYWGFGYGWRGYPYWGHGYGWGGYYGHPWYGAYYRPYYYPRTYTYSATRRGYSNSARTRDTRASSNYFSRYRTSNPNTERYRSSRNSNVRRSSGTYRNSGRASSGGSGRRR